MQWAYQLLKIKPAGSNYSRRTITLEELRVNTLWITQCKHCTINSPKWPADDTEGHSGGVLLAPSCLTIQDNASTVKSVLTYLLTYSMVQSPSWAANWFEASQEIPRISRNPKVHYRTHKCPPPVSILGQPNPVHIPTSHLLQIRPNIIHPSTPRSPQWSLSLRFPHQDPIHPPLSLGY